jgi:hypothetical protein
MRYICIMPGTTTAGAKLPSAGPPPIGSPAGTPWLNTGNFFNNRAPGEHVHKTGYNVNAAPVQVCWHPLDNLRLQLVVQGSQDAAALVAAGAMLVDWFSCYFLPWGPGQIARMELPAQATGASCFLYSGDEWLLLSGSRESCLVACEPPQRDPRQRQPDAGSERQRAVSNGEGTAARKEKGPNLGGTTAGVLRSAAPAGPGDGLTGTRIASSANTPYTLTAAEQTTLDGMVAAELAQQNLKARPAPANPTGTIFDVRVSTMGTLDVGTRRWSFFYQRNAMTHTDAITRLGRAGGLIKFLGKDNRAGQNLQRYLRIPGWEHTVLWPAGVGLVAIPAHGDPDLV